METYPKVLGSDTTVILSTDSDLFKFLKGMDVSSESKPVADPFQ